MPNENMYPDASFLDVVKTQKNVSAAVVADTIGCNARVATNRLKALADKGCIKSEKQAGRWVFWV